MADRFTNPAMIPRYIAALSDPNLAAGEKQLATELLKRSFDAAKPTEKIQTLEALRQRPDLLAIEKELRKSQAPSVNILPGQKKQEEALGGALGEIHAAAIKDALKVGANKATLDAAERAMAQPGFVSGTGQAFITGAKRALIQMGVPAADVEGVGATELFGKLQNKAIMDAGGTASGLGPQISNADANIIKGSSFNLENSIEGNRKIIGYLRLMEDRKVAYAKELNRYANAHKDENGQPKIDIDVIDHMSKWADSHPLDFSKVPGFDRRFDVPPPPDPKVGDVYYGRPYKGGPVTDPASWGDKIEK